LGRFESSGIGRGRRVIGTFVVVVRRRGEEGLKTKSSPSGRVGEGKREDTRLSEKCSKVRDIIFF
jgi:hypothetical protein